MSRPTPQLPPTRQELKHYREVLEENIGKIGMTNHSPTLMAKLIEVEYDRCWFEVTPSEPDGPVKYNSAVGQTFYLPLRMGTSIKFGD